MSKNQLLSDLLNNSKSTVDICDDECNLVGDVRILVGKRALDHGFDWPDQKSSKFYRSALVVPVWNRLSTRFSDKELHTVMYDRQAPFQTIQLRNSRGVNMTCYGFLTIDSLKSNAFDAEDVDILNECALSLFTVLFEVFSIQFEE
jgi:hypothetical protein